MIVKDRRSWLRLLFSFRGSDLPKTWPRLLLVTLLAVAVEVYYELGYPFYSLTALPFTLIGLALSIFLGFRNNESYSRYWEGRRLWGGLVNVARSFTRQILTLVDTPAAGADDPDEAARLHAFRREIVLRTIAYVHALRHHLRGSDPSDDIAGFLPPEDCLAARRHRNVPLAILQQTAGRIQWAWRDGWIRDFHVTALDASLTEMTALQGGCERIKATPIPFAYTVLIHRIVAFYCVLLPFGIVDSVKYVTPLVVLLISHAFFGLDDIGDEIEDPFGTDANDLPLHAITRTIELNLLQLIDDPNVPELPQPVDYVLL